MKKWGYGSSILGASEKKTFIGRLVDGCPVLPYSVALSYAGRNIRHIRSWPGALAHADQITLPARVKPTPGLHTHYGRGRPELGTASCGVCPRDRVD